MLITFVAFLSASITFYCHGLPASMSETHSSASQKLHLYMNNSTDDVNYQLRPVLTQLHQTNEEVELVRNAIIPFFNFLFDILGDVEDETGDCLDDMDIQMTPDDLSDPSFPNVITERSESNESIEPTDVPYTW